MCMCVCVRAGVCKCVPLLLFIAIEVDTIVVGSYKSLHTVCSAARVCVCSLFFSAQ